MAEECRFTIYNLQCTMYDYGTQIAQITQILNSQFSIPVHRSPFTLHPYQQDSLWNNIHPYPIFPLNSCFDQDQLLVVHADAAFGSVGADGSRVMGAVDTDSGP